MDHSTNTLFAVKVMRTEESTFTLELSGTIPSTLERLIIIFNIFIDFTIE